MILGLNTYKNVKAMLDSPDVENNVVGLQCIENSGFRDNIIYILFLMKESKLEPELWKEHAPETLKNFTLLFKVDLVGATITYTVIMRLMKLYEASREHYQFYMDRYSEHLTSQFNEGQVTPVIESIQIIIKQTPHESRTASQSI